MWTPWRNGSASDSRSEGCVFESRRGQTFWLWIDFLLWISVNSMIQFSSKKHLIFRARLSGRYYFVALRVGCYNIKWLRIRSALLKEKKSETSKLILKNCPPPYQKILATRLASVVYFCSRLASHASVNKIVTFVSSSRFTMCTGNPSLVGFVGALYVVSPVTAL